MKLCGRCAPVKRGFKNETGVGIHNGYAHHGCPYCPFVSQDWTDWWEHMSTKHPNEERHNRLAKVVEPVVEDLNQKTDERALREIIWSMHMRTYSARPHMAYGDDGQLQCCGIDFINWTPEQISAGLERLRSRLSR